MSWFDHLKEFIILGREAHNDRFYLAIIVFWIIAALLTILLIFIGIYFYNEFKNY